MNHQDIGIACLGSVNGRSGTQSHDFDFDTLGLFEFGQQIIQKTGIAGGSRCCQNDFPFRFGWCCGSGSG
ncbi:hypothetical protein SDC9_201952 [bioreactor metagenome]|uniref:Uncharacterized protein n=1 Tax=bioreactor metagenome TaxID=1076179 RepID=A0A645ITW0_9ZZZZ